MASNSGARRGTAANPRVTGETPAVRVDLPAGGNLNEAIDQLRDQDTQQRQQQQQQHNPTGPVPPVPPSDPRQDVEMIITELLRIAQDLTYPLAKGGASIISRDLGVAFSRMNCASRILAQASDLARIITPSADPELDRGN